MPENSKNSKCVFFWGGCKDLRKIHKGCLSQWQKIEFEVDGITYQCAEQFMMAEKARLFKDYVARAMILDAKLPKKIKELGRKVRGFDEKTWDEKKFDIVVRGNKAKFSQNPSLLAFLTGTGDATLAEASPYDRIWGIGLKESDKRILDRREWEGENLLGKALMRVREELAGTKDAEAAVKDYQEEFRAGARSVVDVYALRMRREKVKKPVSVDPVGPVTSREFVESLQASVKSSHQYVKVEDKTVRRVEVVDPKAVEKFARDYKPFVFGVLKKSCRFRLTRNGEALVNGNIDAEDVFHEVVIRFLKNKELKSLNLFKDGAGKTPFRNYLSVVVRSAFHEMAGKDLVEAIGPDGKCRYIQRNVAIGHIADLAWDEHKPKMWAPIKSNKHLVKLLQDILTIAYVSVHENMNRNGWQYDAMAAIFERGEDDKAVAMRLWKEGKINRINTFETAKSRFAGRWRTRWMNMYRCIFKDKDEWTCRAPIIAKLWSETKKLFGNYVYDLRVQIADWAFDYADRALKKGAEKNEHHRY